MDLIQRDYICNMIYCNEYPIYTKNNVRNIS